MLCRSSPSVTPTLASPAVESIRSQDWIAPGNISRPFAARPLGYGRNSLSTSPNSNLDLRILKMVPVAQGILVSLRSRSTCSSTPTSASSTRPMALALEHNKDSLDPWARLQHAGFNSLLTTKSNDSSKTAANHFVCEVSYVLQVSYFPASMAPHKLRLPDLLCSFSHIAGTDSKRNRSRRRR